MVSLSFHKFLSIFFYYFQRNVKIYGSSRIPSATPITVAPTGLAILEKQQRPVAQRALDTFHIEAAWKTLHVRTYVPQHFTKRGNATSGWFSTADKYEQYVDGLGWVENEQPCAPGTQIDPITCKCSQLIGKRKIKLVTNETWPIHPLPLKNQFA